MMKLAWLGLAGYALVSATNATASSVSKPAVPAVHGDAGCLPRPSDGATAEPTRDELRAAGAKVVGEMMSGTLARPTDVPARDRAAPELSSLSMDVAFGGLWARCGLTKRERSLVTLGILMALRANSEMEYHFRIAEANGLSRREIEEAIYQASGYAGFPAAANASQIYGKVLKEDAAPRK